MFTLKDIDTRTIFVLNCFYSERRLKVHSGELLFDEVLEDGKTRTLTKFPFQKILVLFVIGPISITTPLIDKCRKFGVALVVVKANLRPVYIWANSAEANYLLRKKQFDLKPEDISIAKILVKNKIQNQKRNLQKTRKKDTLTNSAIEYCNVSLGELMGILDYNQLMGLEGRVSKNYFSAYFQSLDWTGRHPRIKDSQINVALDIGYSILFNLIECFLRLFGFDVYVGVYHRLWFKRKSLVCDIVEPFRCIIDHTVLLGFNRGQFKKSDFEESKGVFQLKREKSMDYYRVFYEALLGYKSEMFVFVQKYYRCFMGRMSVKSYPEFEYK